MQSILQQQREHDYRLGIQPDVKIGSIHDYIERERKKHAGEDDSDSSVEDEVEETNHKLDDSNHKLGDIFQTLKDIVRDLRGVKAAILEHPGHLHEIDRPYVQEQALKEKPTKTSTQSMVDDIRAGFKEVVRTFTTKSGFADLLFGKPEKGTWRANGREYNDALKQYTKDRMMLKGPELIKQHGSELAAQKAIRREYHSQQDLKKQIAVSDKEIKRRRAAGMDDFEINGERGGNLLAKHNDLLDKYAAVDPMNTGKRLDPNNKGDSLTPLPTIDFGTPAADKPMNVNRTVHRDYTMKAEADKIAKELAGRDKNDINADSHTVDTIPAEPKHEPTVGEPIHRHELPLPTIDPSALEPKRPAAQPAPLAVADTLAPDTSQEDAEEAEQRFDKQMGLQQEQINLLEQIANSLSHPVEQKEEKEEQKGGIGETIGAAKNALSMTNRLGSLARFAGPAAGVIGAGAAGYAVGTGINKAWEATTGNTVGNSLYNVFGEDKRVEDINKPVSKEEMDEYRKKKAMNPAVAPTPAPVAVPTKTAVALETSRQANANIKKETDKQQAAAAVVAPVTVNNNVGGGGGGETKRPSTAIRNPDTTISRYVASRYIPQAPPQ